MPQLAVNSNFSENNVPFGPSGRAGSPNPPPGRSTADSRSRLPSKNIPSHPKRTNRPDNIRHKCSRRIPSRFLRYRLNSGKRDAAGFVLFPVYAIFAKITFARTGRIPETRNRIVQRIRAVLTQNKKFSHEKTIPNPVCRSPVLSDIQGDRRLHQLHHHPGSLLGRLGDGLLRRRLPPALRRTLQNLRRALQTRHDAPGL